MKNSALILVVMNATSTGVTSAVKTSRNIITKSHFRMNHPRGEMTRFECGRNSFAILAATANSLTIAKSTRLCSGFRRSSRRALASLP